MNTARDDSTERLVDGAMEVRLARDAGRLLSPFDHHALATRLGAEVRRRRRQRYSIAAATAVVMAGGIAFWTIHDGSAPADGRVIAQQPAEAVKVARPRRIAHSPMPPDNPPGDNIQLPTIPHSPANERHVPGQGESGMDFQTGSPLVGIPFVIEPAEGSGRQPMFGIYVPGGSQPLDAADLSPAEQRAVYRVLGIQYVSTDNNTL